MRRETAENAEAKSLLGASHDGVYITLSFKVGAMGGRLIAAMTQYTSRGALPRPRSAWPGIKTNHSIGSRRPTCELLASSCQHSEHSLAPSGPAMLPNLNEPQDAFPASQTLTTPCTGGVCIKLFTWCIGTTSRWGCRARACGSADRIPDGKS
jgi:hypothetical protein